MEQLDMRLHRDEQRAPVDRFGSRGLVDYEDCGGSERSIPCARPALVDGV